MADIERIERELRAGLDMLSSWQATKPVSNFSILHKMTIGDLRALLDELARLRRLEHAVYFAAKMAWREDPPHANQKLSDAERLSAIKWHPTIKDLGKAYLEPTHAE